MMRKQTPILTLFLALFSTAFPQVVDTDLILSEIENGNLEKAETAMISYLKGEQTITQEDSLFVFRHLGIISAAQPEKQPTAREYFMSMLKIDPASHLLDTYASHSIMEFFRKTKKDFQVKFGGASLLPKVLVMDAVSDVIKEKDKSSLSRQLIEELQSRTRIFNTVDRDEMEEELKKINRSQLDCKSNDCYVELGKLLLADKVILLELSQFESSFILSLKMLDVETGDVETLLKKTSQESPDPLILTGLSELAIELEQENAAWLQLSVQPANSYLELDGEPTSGSNRIPVNAGIHLVCATAPGHINACKSLKVQKNDALTHVLVLKPDLSEKPQVSTGAKNQSTEGIQNAFEEEEDDTVPGQPTLVWWILGGMAGVSILLAVLFNSPN